VNAVSLTFDHVTVLGTATVDALRDVPAGWVVDCTLGGGGHSELLLESLSHVRVLGVDRDPQALKAAQERLCKYGPRFEAVHAPFGDLSVVCKQHNISKFVGVIADLGVSSHQLDTEDRGFSFRYDGPLDMRMDPTRGQTLADKLRRTSKRELADVLYYFGDVRASHRVADAILAAYGDGVRGTSQLADCIAAVLPRGGKIHPATRAFQALRMWVNDEIEQLERLVATVPYLLSPGGVFAVISFHSGEDRVVKQVFREFARGKTSSFELPHRKPLTPTPQECAQNPRARSAKLRVLRFRGASAEQEAS